MDKAEYIFEKIAYERGWFSRNTSDEMVVKEYKKRAPHRPNSLTVKHLRKELGRRGIDTSTFDSTLAQRPKFDKQLNKIANKIYGKDRIHPSQEIANSLSSGKTLTQAQLALLKKYGVPNPLERLERMNKNLKKSK